VEKERISQYFKQIRELLHKNNFSNEVITTATEFHNDLWEI